MSRLRFDPDKLEAELATLSPFHRVAFAAACCERLLPNYHAFSEEEGWGDYQVMRSALDEVWGSLRRGLFSAGTIQSLIARCDAEIPDTEDFDSPLTSPALDAGAAIVETLKCSLDGTPARAAAVAGLARDTVDMHVQWRDDMDYADPRFEEKILRDPLMVRELKKQRADLELLKRTPVINAALIRRLTKDARSNIDLEPVTQNETTSK